MQILVFEDDALLAGMYQRMLERAGHQVVIVTDGQEGLDKVASLSPAVILMDIMMPKLNGLQALKTLKSDPATASIPVVVMTAMKQAYSESEVLALGAAAYVDKTEYDARALVNLVTSMLGESPVPEVA